MAEVTEVGGTDGSHRVEKCMDRWSGIFRRRSGNLSPCNLFNKPVRSRK